MASDAFPISFFSPEDETLDLQSGARLTVPFLRKVIDRSPNLLHVNLSGCFYVDDPLIQTLLKTCPSK